MGLPPPASPIITIQTLVMTGVNSKVLKMQERLSKTTDTELQAVLLSSERDKGRLQEDTML